MSVNYLGTYSTTSGTILVVPQNTTEVVVTKFSGLWGDVPSINGTAVTPRFYQGTGGSGQYKIYEMYPSPPAGTNTYSSTDGVGVTCYFYSGAGTIRSGEVNKVEEFTVGTSAAGTIATTHDDYLMMWATRIAPGQYVDNTILNGKTSTTDPNINSSSGTVANYQINMDGLPGSVNLLVFSTTTLVPTSPGGYMAMF